MPESVPDTGEWELTIERSARDSFVGREYTTIVFAHSPTGQKVMINDVQEPNNFGGWGYLVHVTGPEYGELALVEDLQTAREVADNFMNSYSE